MVNNFQIGVRMQERLLMMNNMKLMKTLEAQKPQVEKRNLVVNLGVKMSGIALKSKVFVAVNQDVPNI